MAGISRRKLMALGCSAAASPFLTPVAFASLPTDNRLVVIILRGAMDGLDVVQPYGDPSLAAARPGFDIGPAAGAHDLDGFFAMHPGLSDLLPLWRADELAFSHAVSTPYRNQRSHFDGQDLLEAGTQNGTQGQVHPDGWLNRLLQTFPGATRDTAVAIGQEDALILRGTAPALAWSPSSRLSLTQSTSDLLSLVYHDDPLFQANFEDAQFYSSLLFGEFVEEGTDGMEMMAASMERANRAGNTSVIADFAAERLRAEARVASFSIGGWDTHRGQSGGITRALRHLSTAILRLKEGLGPEWGRTTVLAMTEFGRTVHGNGSRGTDHGTGGAMVMAGGALRGGRVFGQWPGLEEAALFDRRDLMPTGDVRAYAAWAMAGLFGTEQSVLATQVFPGLDLGDDPGLLR